MKRFLLLFLITLAAFDGLCQQKVNQGNNRNNTQDTKITPGASGVRRSIGYRFSTIAEDSDPGTGIFRFNDRTISKVKWVYVDDIDISGEDQTKWYSTWDDTTGATGRGSINIVEYEGTNVGMFNITGVFIRGEGYWKFPVEYISGQIPAGNALYYYVFNRIAHKKPQTATVTPAPPAAVTPPAPQQAPEEKPVTAVQPQPAPTQVAQPEQVQQPSPEQKPVQVQEPAPVQQPVPVQEPVSVQQPAPVAQPEPATVSQPVQVQEPAPAAQPQPQTAPAPKPVPEQEPILQAKPQPAAQPSQESVPQKVQPAPSRETTQYAERRQPANATQPAQQAKPSPAPEAPKTAQPAPASQPQPTAGSRPATQANTNTQQVQQKQPVQAVQPYEPAPYNAATPVNRPTEISNPYANLDLSERSRRKCYRGIIELGYAWGTGDYGISNFRINFINGIMIGKVSSIGLGIGYRRYFEGLETYNDRKLYSPVDQVPVFLDLRTSFTRKKVTPYLALGIGGSASFIKVNVDSTATRQEGLYFCPSGGIWFNLSERLALFAGVAYELQRLEYVLLADDSHFRRNTGSVSLNIGIAF